MEKKVIIYLGEFPHFQNGKVIVNDKELGVLDLEVVISNKEEYLLLKIDMGKVEILYSE